MTGPWKGRHTHPLRRGEKTPRRQNETYGEKTPGLKRVSRKGRRSPSLAEATESDPLKRGVGQSGEPDPDHERRMDCG